LPAGCQQRAGLRSLRSLRPLPTSTASPLCGNLYPSGPSPCPCDVHPKSWTVNNRYLHVLSPVLHRT
jgi:hypothetical protein